MKKLIWATVVLTFGFFVAASHAANDYPNRPVKILVPYPPGGPSDISARLVADALTEKLGQRVIVENRPGASGMLGTEATIRGDHDGYTLLLGGTGSLVLMPAVKPEYQPLKQLWPLTTLWHASNVIAVRRDLGFKSLNEFITYAKANPGKINFGSAGIGSTTHIAILLLNKAAAIDISHVPYRNTALWVNDAIANRIDGGIGDTRTLLPFVESKSLMALAVMVPNNAAKRLPELPDIPTVEEAGFPGTHMENWFGLFVLRGTPEPVLSRLRSAIVEAQADPKYAAALQKAGASVGKTGADQLQSLLDRDIKQLVPLMKTLTGQLN